MKAQSANNAIMNRVSKRLYNIHEAADYLGRSPWAVREMIYAGKLPHVRDGKRVLLDIHDMDKWIEKSRTCFTPEGDLTSYRPLVYYDNNETG
jgi:excisionase family DNA binding protein